MLLIDCKVELSLKQIKNCVLTTAEIGANAEATGADSATLEVTHAKLFVSVVTLSAEDNVKLVKQLNKGFKKPVYWNKYKVIDNKVVETAAANEEKLTSKLLDSRYEGAKRLFVLAYDHTALIDGRNFYDEPINDLIKQYNQVRKISTEQGDTTGCELDFAYFEKNYRLIAADLSKQKFNKLFLLVK